MNRILVYGMTENQGGIETFVMNMFRTRPADYIFDFVVDWDRMAYEDEVKAQGSRVFHITKKSISLKKQWAEFHDILEKHPEYKIVYFNLMNAGTVLNMFPAYRAKRLIVAHSHNGATDKMKMHRLFRPWLNRIADVKFACSSLASDFMFGKSKAEVKIIHNAIDLKKFQYDENARTTLRKNYHLEDAFTVLHVGRMNIQKNPIFMLSVFMELAKQEPSAKLVYIGTGEMEEEVHRFVEENKLTDRVLFLGLRQDVNEWMSAADLFLLPSLFEGLPITLVEAQSSGIPVFCSDVISKEVQLSDVISFLSLEDGPVFWVKEILKAKGYQRMPKAAPLLEKYYDISEIGKSFWNLLREMEGNTNESD